MYQWADTARTPAGEGPSPRGGARHRCSRLCSRGERVRRMGLGRGLGRRAAWSRSRSWPQSRRDTCACKHLERSAVRRGDELHAEAGTAARPVLDPGPTAVALGDAGDEGTRPEAQPWPSRHGHRHPRWKRWNTAALSSSATPGPVSHHEEHPVARAWPPRRRCGRPGVGVARGVVEQGLEHGRRGDGPRSPGTGAGKRHGIVVRAAVIRRTSAASEPGRPPRAGCRPFVAGGALEQGDVFVGPP